VVAEIADEAGFPPGVVNVVPHAPGAAGPIADEFFAADEVRRINLIGGVKTARLLAARAGQPLKRTCLELGGYNPIVDEMNVIAGAEDRASAADTFRRLYWDTALSLSDPVLAMLRSVVGMDHVLFGTDYPYLRRDLAVGSRGHIAATAELTAEEKTAVPGGTAATLIPRLAPLAVG
jgi:Aldehyde dehydrogenase family/Amidohydrolase